MNKTSPGSEAQDKALIEHRIEAEVLRYCLEELARREAEDPHRAWLWAGRRRVAKFCLARSRARAGGEMEPPDWRLSEENKRTIRRNHDLLAAAIPPVARSAEHEEWLARVTARMRRFARALARRR